MEADENQKYQKLITFGGDTSLLQLIIFVVQIIYFSKMLLYSYKLLSPLR